MKHRESQNSTPSQLIDARIEELDDFREREAIDEDALKTLVRAAVTLNTSKTKR